MKWLRGLLWTYLVLLLIEGALRKWTIPQLDAPLLIIRDPVAILIYVLALLNRLSFRNAFFVPNLVLAVTTTILSVIFGYGNLIITLFGVRTDYLQIPLIFLIPQIINRDDVIAIGRFLMFAALPMAALVAVQFSSPPDSLLNKGALGTHYGTVRPSGTFSFVTGIVGFYSLVTSFLFFGFIQERTYKIWLLSLATMATLVAAGCSGSRSCLSSIGIVAAVAILCVMVRGRGGLGILAAAVAIALAMVVLSGTDVFQKGSSQLVQRFQDAGAQEGNATGFVDRFLSTMFIPLDDLEEIPLFGNGLGLGTNAAAGLIGGDREFLGPENEWGRFLFECGPIFGCLLILFRIALTLTIAHQVYRAFRVGNVLPLLIFAACWLPILIGQWGVPTTLGFAIYGAGLTLAACQEPSEEYEDEDDGEMADGESEHGEEAHEMD